MREPATDDRVAVLQSAIRSRVRRYWRHPFVRYCMIGAVNTAFDFSIYTTLTRSWGFWRMHYLSANIISFSIVVTWSFFWNKYWTFRVRSARHGTQYVKFVAVTLVGIGIAQTILALGVSVFGIRDLFAKLIAGPAVAFWNFTAYRFWAFAERGATTVSETPS